MKASELLRAALRMLNHTAVGRDIGLCKCVESTAKRITTNHRNNPAKVLAIACARERVLQRIGDDLGHSLCLSGWLMDTGHTTWDELLTKDGCQRLRATSVAWAERMIADFEAKGD